MVLRGEVGRVSTLFLEFPPDGYDDNSGWGLMISRQVRRNELGLQSGP